LEQVFSAYSVREDTWNQNNLEKDFSAKVSDNANESDTSAKTFRIESTGSAIWSASYATSLGMGKEAQCQGAISIINMIF
jgi:hypothetical protein